MGWTNRVHLDDLFTIEVSPNLSKKSKKLAELCISNKSEPGKRDTSGSRKNDTTENDKSSVVEFRTRVIERTLSILRESSYENLMDTIMQEFQRVLDSELYIPMLINAYRSSLV